MPVWISGVANGIPDGTKVRLSVVNRYTITGLVGGMTTPIMTDQQMDVTVTVQEGVFIGPTPINMQGPGNYTINAYTTTGMPFIASMSGLVTGPTSP